MKNLLLNLLLCGLVLFGSQRSLDACHAIALVNFNQQTINGATSITVNAASNSPTCGCAVYWLDLEVRCLQEPFDAAPFAPGFWGPLGTYPYFQSAQMNKPNCVVQNYPGITIPFAGLCPGMTYQYRMRENHHGLVGPWCATQTFTVPGATAPLVMAVNASNTVICAGDCVNLDAVVVQGCGLAASYQWSTGATTQSINVCPAVTTTYTVDVVEQCSGFVDQVSVTITVAPPPVAGVASISATTICAGDPITLDLVGSAGVIQWEEGPLGGGGPWAPIAGATGTTLNLNPGASACYRAEVTGCGVGPGAVVYSNVVCVTVDPAPVADFNYIPACPGGTTDFTDASTSGSAITTWAWDFDGLGTSAAQNPSFTFPGNGPYNVTLTVTNATGCSNTIVLPVNMSAGPTPNFTHVVACPGAATAFTDQTAVGGGAVITTWAWDFDGQGTSAAQNPNFVFTNPGNYNVTLVVTTNSGCSNTITLPVVVPEIPVADFTMQDVCLGSPGVFNDASTVGGGATITAWNWDMGEPGPIYNTQNVNHTYPNNNAYTVTLTVTSSAGCTHTTNQIVQIFPNPTADFTFAAACQGNPTVFTDASIGNGGTINQWAWDFDGDAVIDDVNQNPQYTFPASGNYNVDLTVTTVNGCSGTVNLPVTVQAQPIADFTFTNVCEGNNVTFTDNSNPNGGVISGYQWFSNGTQFSTATSPTEPFPTEGVYDIELVVTSSLGCTDTVNYNLEVYPNPVADFTPQSVCLNVPVNFQDASTVSNANTANVINQWAWDLDPTLSNQQNPPSETYTVAGNYTISLTVTTDRGCSNTINVPIDIYDKPVADFNFADDCVNLGAALTDASTINGASPITDWWWDIDGDGNTDYTTQNVNHLYNTPGTYNVELIVGSGFGCTDTIVQTITRYPIPDASFATANECEYDSVCFTNLSVVAAPDNIISNIWNYGDGTPLNGALSPCHMYNNEGNYFVTLIVTSNNGCSDDTTIAVEVYAKPDVSFTATAVCENTPPTQFTNTSSITSGTMASYNWDFDDNSAPSAVVSPSHVYGSAGVYNVVLIGVSDHGCLDTMTLPVDVYAKPVAVMSVDQSEGCPVHCVTFGADNSISNAGAIVSWDWDLGNGLTSNVANPNSCYNNTGNLLDVNYDVELIVTNDLGCKDTILEQNFITVHPLPIASFDPSPAETNEHDPVIGTINNSVGATFYDWDFGDGNTSSLFEPENFYTDTGWYNITLIAITDYGCADTTVEQAYIEPVPTVYVPNAFTPDGDGINDDFKPMLYGYQNAEYSFYIFDRWGELIFETHDQSVAWDGSVKSMAVNSKTDVYVWKVIITSNSDGGKKEYIGHVTLLK